jgi:hypothetical protein
MARLNTFKGYVVTGPTADRLSASFVRAYAVVTAPGGGSIEPAEDTGQLPTAHGQMYPRVGAVPNAGTNATSIQGVAVSATAPAAGQSLVFNGAAYAPGPSGGEVLIEERVLGAATGMVTFDNIPQTYRHLRLCYLGRTTATNGGQWTTVAWRCNNDATAGNYFTQHVHGINGASGGGTGSGVGGFDAGWIANANAPAGSVASGNCLMLYYRQTTWWKTFVSHSQQLPASGATPLSIAAGGGWRSTAAVTRVDFFPSSGGQFAAGSIFALYGVP